MEKTQKLKGQITMKDALKKFEKEVGEVIGQFSNKTMEEELDLEAYKQVVKTIGFTQYGYTDDQTKHRLRSNKKQELKNQYYTDTAERIDNAKGLLRAAYDRTAAEIDRKRILARTGQNIISKYAEMNGIDRNQAKRELDEYASVKTNGYSNTTTDRYAAIRNRDKLNGQDRLYADLYLEDEYKALDIKDKNDGLKSAEYYLNRSTADLIQNWNSSGMSMARDLYGHYKPNDKS